MLKKINAGSGPAVKLYPAGVPPRKFQSIHRNLWSRTLKKRFRFFLAGTYHLKERFRISLACAYHLKERFRISLACAYHLKERFRISFACA